MRKNKPATLKPGDKIGIVSPARFVIPSEIDGALKWIRSKGFEPVLGKHVFDRMDQFAGEDKDRASDIKAFMEDPEISCIWSTRGGYGSVRLIPFLSEISLETPPKWFVGFSDLTVFHSWFHVRFNLQSIHGPMLYSWNESPESLESFSALNRVLSTGRIDYEYNRHPLNRGDEMQGVLVGGNLSMLYSLRGTDLDLVVNHKILFLEDVDEYLYHLDRMMQNLKHAGWLSGISGLVIGGMNKMNDNNIPFGHTPEEIITSLTADSQIPVFFGHPAGHQDRNMPLVFGEEIRLQCMGDIVHSRQ